MRSKYFSICLLISSVHAANPNMLQDPIIMLSAGPAWSTPGKTQTVNVSLNAPNTYINHSDTQTLGIGELFFGIQHPLSKKIQSQWGALISGTNTAKLKGDIWQLGEPELDNLSYTYNINQFRVGLRTKWLFEQNFIASSIRPYIGGSIGVGFNHAFDYQNTPKLSTVAANPNFQKNTMTAFSYSVGLGLQKAITKNMQASIGYEMLDWGKSELSAAMGQASSQGLSLNHLYMQTLLFSLTYSANEVK